MRLIATLLLALTMVSAAFAEPSMPERLQDNTVILTDFQGHGSGVLFTRNEADRQVTFVWTAAHVADIWMNPDGTYEPIPVVQGDKIGKARVLRVGDHEAGVDVALLQVIEGDFVGTAEFYRGFNEVKVGQKVIHCGTPLDREWNERLISYGRIANVDRLVSGPPLLAPRRIDQVDITAYPGCSGGPVVDEGTGGIVGLLVMGSAPRLTIIEPTRRIYQWAKTHDCLWAFDHTVSLPATMMPWPSDRHLRQVRERQCPLDDDWGSLKVVEPVTAPAIIPTVDAILDSVLDPLCPIEVEMPVAEPKGDDAILDLMSRLFNPRFWCFRTVLAV